MLDPASLILFFSFFWLAIADVNVTAADNEIIWPSSPLPLWTPTESRCSSQGQAHFAYRPNMSVSYEFTGTAIYIALLRSNVTGVYTVSVDNGDPVFIDGYHITTICDQQLGQSGLSFGAHTVTLAVYGPSPQLKNASVNTYLEIDAFIYTSPNGSASSSTSPIPTSPASARRSSLKTPAIVGIVVALSVSLAAIVVFVFFFLQRRSHRKNPIRCLTILDRGTIYPGHVSQFPPASNSTRQSSVSPAMHLIDTTGISPPVSQAVSPRVSQISPSRGVKKIQLQNLANQMPMLLSVEGENDVRVRDLGDAPPRYDP